MNTNKSYIKHKKLMKLKFQYCKTKIMLPRICGIQVTTPFVTKHYISIIIFIDSVNN